MPSGLGACGTGCLGDGAASANPYRSPLLLFLTVVKHLKNPSLKKLLDFISCLMLCLCMPVYIYYISEGNKLEFVCDLTEIQQEVVELSI